ncbi:hypothetical protein GC167_08630 [bacterium]|nr:hypothetical protein [bacterium]
MKRLLFSSLALIAVATSVQAQTDSTLQSLAPAPADTLLPTEPVATRAVATEEEILPVLPPEPAKQPRSSGNAKHGLGINFGLNGAGVDYAYMPGEMLAFRGRFQTLPFTLNIDDLEFSETYVGVDGSLNFTNLDLLVDFYPFKSSFKIVGGLGYFFNNRITSKGFFVDDLQLGELVVEPNDIGYVEIQSEWAKLAPYFGLGFGKAVPNSRIGFGFELGTYYGGSPDVTIIATDMLSETSQEEAELEENLKDYAWIPYLNFRLSIRII